MLVKAVFIMVHNGERFHTQRPWTKWPYFVIVDKRSKEGKPFLPASIVNQECLVFQREGMKNQMGKWFLPRTCPQWGRRSEEEEVSLCFVHSALSCRGRGRRRRGRRWRRGGTSRGEAASGRRTARSHKTSCPQSNLEPPGPSSSVLLSPGNGGREIWPELRTYFGVKDAIRKNHGSSEEVDDRHPGLQPHDGDDEEQVDHEGGGDEESVDHPGHDHLQRLLSLRLHLLLKERQARVARVWHGADTKESVSDVEAVEDVVGGQVFEVGDRHPGVFHHAFLPTVLGGWRQTRLRKSQRGFSLVYFWAHF